MARCATCNRERQVVVDGKCGSCSALHANLRYPWTPEMDLLLQRVYRAARNKTDLSTAITITAKRFRMPRYIVQNRAQHLGLRIREQKLWTDAEIETLRELSGSLSTAQIARELGRTTPAVKHKLFSMSLSAEVNDGLSQNALAALMGVHHATVQRWCGRGWLHVDQNQLIQEDVIERFIWEHMSEIRFARCDEMWLKQMLQSGRRKNFRKLPAPELVLRRTA